MEQQLKALDESVRIWEYKVSLSSAGMLPPMIACPLCALNEGDCKTCIIKKDTGRNGCKKTPYRETSMVQFGVHPEGDVRMLEYLKNLRRKLTMGNEELKVGDVVTMPDSSYLIWLNGDNDTDVFRGYTPDISPLASCLFTIVEIAPNQHIRTASGNKGMHDVVIKSIISGNLFLHSKCMLKLAEPKVKEVTMADLEAKYGCKVKVVKS